MKEITQKTIEDFILKTDIRLGATQQKLCIPIINRIYHKMKYGIRFSPIKVCDNLIIDGHHRYISSLLAGIEIENIFRVQNRVQLLNIVGKKFILIQMNGIRIGKLNN